MAHSVWDRNDLSPELLVALFVRIRHCSISPSKYPYLTAGIYRLQ